MSKSAERLAWPFAVSLLLHLGVGWLFSTGWMEHQPSKVKAVTLTVSLSSREHSDPAPISAPEPAPPPPLPLAQPALTGATESSGTVTQKARFLVDPDLAALEQIPVPFSGSMNIRLHVTALGTVERVTVTKSDPVPKELLDGIQARLEKARLTPALAGSTPVASTVDVVIRYEAGIIPLAKGK